MGIQLKFNTQVSPLFSQAASKMVQMTYMFPLKHTENNSNDNVCIVCKLHKD
jgi:hypothetical protein